MILQLNLLPDIKLEFIKARRNKRMIMLISTAIIGVSLAATILMVSFVYGAQAKHLKDLDKDIDSGISKIQTTEGVNEILTIQNQLSVINSKHQEKPDVTRILSYIGQILPDGTKVTNIGVDFTGYTISIDGTTPGINVTNQLVDTFKFAEYSTVSGVKGKPFSEVVTGSFPITTGESPFSINMKFDPIIFNNSEEVSIIIPGSDGKAFVTTRSSTEKPVFTEDPKAEGTEE